MSLNSRKDKNTIRSGRMILKILVDAFDYWENRYVFYSQEKWLKELKRHFSYDIKRRQLNYIFASVEKFVIIKRFKGHRRDKEKGYIFKSSRCYVAAAGWKMARHLKMVTRKEYQKMINAIKKGVRYKVNGGDKWETPAWYKEYLPNSSDLAPEPDG